MKLPIPFIAKKEKPRYFLALLLRGEKVSAIIIEEYSGKIKVISKADEYFPTNIEEASPEVWLDVLNKAISKAEETLPANIETKDTVFGVKEDWVEDKKIKKEYLAKLKKASDALGLAPIGFLVISEAIAYLIAHEEGAPLTALLTEHGKKQVMISLIRGGKIVETHEETITGSIPQTVDTLLKSFTSVEVLPSRLIVFNGEKNDELAQQFISHQWSKSLPFLHMPQISVLPSGFDGRAVVFGAAAQMGFEVAENGKNPSGSSIQTFTPKPMHAEVELPKEKSEEIAEEAVEKSSEEPVAELAPAPAAEDIPTQTFGFVVGRDVGEEAQKIKPKETFDEEKNIETASHKEETENEPIEKPQSHFILHNERSEIEDTNEEPMEEEDEHAILPHHHTPGTEKSRKSFSFKKIPLLLGSLGGKSINMFRRVSTTIRTGNKLLLLLPLILLIIVGAVVIYLLSVHSTVTLTLKGNTIQQKKAITFSTTDPSDFDKNIIHAQDISTAIDGSASQNATGKKDVGQKATGSITLYNSDTNPKDLSNGTVLTSTNNLNFTLDKDVTVASATGDIFSGIQSGTTQTTVTASDIGTQYNLPSGTKFSITNDDTIAGKNDAAFSGGSKQQVTVIAKADTDSLLSQLPKSLEDKANTSLTQKLGDSSVALPGFLDETVSKKYFDKNVGDQANSVTLKGTVTFNSASYSKQDLINFSKQVLKDQSNNMTLSDDSIQSTISDIQQNKDNTISANANIQAALFPTLDTKQLANSISGKSTTDAINILKQQSQIENVTISFSPNIPFIPQILPHLSGHIVIVTSHE